MRIKPYNTIHPILIVGLPYIIEFNYLENINVYRATIIPCRCIKTENVFSNGFHSHHKISSTKT